MQIAWYIDLARCTISRVTRAGVFAYILYVVLPGSGVLRQAQGRIRAT